MPETVEITLSPGRIEDYARFLAAKQLPRYEVVGRTIRIPAEYADRLGVTPPAAVDPAAYVPRPDLFDYQRDIAKLAVRKRKFAAFVECGLGKTLIGLEFARHALDCLPRDKAMLIVSPLMVVKQTLAEAARFYGDQLPIERVKAADLGRWIESGPGRLGITNYDGLDESIPRGRLGGLILDESSLLKSHYGKWGQECLRLGAGLDWKLCMTGTPAPNDRIEYANHAVFLDAFPTTNAFLARYFVNKGQTGERWVLKPHALGSFYRDLSHFSIFLTNPATYGWQDNAGTIPPIRVHIHDIPLTPEQRRLLQAETGSFVADRLGGITSRSKLSRLAKGQHDGQSVPTNKPQFIRDLVDSFGDESALIWCHFNAEQDDLARVFPEAASLDGSTPMEKREAMIDEFKARARRVLISKPKVLGFGLNLQVATRQVFSGIQDSYEEYHQAVKRSNRVGSTKPLDVHIPVTELEAPMIENVLRKANRVQQDTEEQERLFKGSQVNF